MRKERPPLFDRLKKGLEDVGRGARGEIQLKSTLVTVSDEEITTEFGPMVPGSAMLLPPGAIPFDKTIEDEETEKIRKTANF